MKSDLNFFLRCYAIYYNKRRKSKIFHFYFAWDKMILAKLQMEWCG